VFAIRLALTVLLIACAPVALAATDPADVAKAEAARKKPLQRCDQLNDQAELDCLKKARERIVEARQKRETAGKSEDSAPAKK
jgi:hypothetical protein